MNAEFFAAIFDPKLPSPTGLTTWNGSDPTARFAVYRNNVIVSLIDALVDTYPVTHALVGDEFFRAMASEFVRGQPPLSRMLTFYGETLPTFIESFAPAASVPYLADIARLEFLRVKAYHAADTCALSNEAIAQALANTDELPNMRIEFQPSVGLIFSQYAVVALWAAHQGITHVSSVNPEIAESALILRPNLDVEVISLHAGAGEFIASLTQGLSLGLALEKSNKISADFDLAATIGLLIRTQAISAITQTKPKRAQP